MIDMNGKVVAVHRSPIHKFSKDRVESINLIQGEGVEGDAHCGKLMKHRSRTKQVPIPPNLRQVHLIHSELFDELEEKGFKVLPGQIGENITTQGIDLLGLPKGTKMRIGKDAVIKITGLRNPCNQLNEFQEGLLSAVLDKDEEGKLIRKSGIMGVVLVAGQIKDGDNIYVDLPDEPYIALERV